MMGSSARVVIVTKKTALEELLERHSTRDRARFYVRSQGADFSTYEGAHETYRAALDHLRDALPRGTRAHWIDRTFLPNYTFDEGQLVVTVGPDGLVVNTAKYLTTQHLLALNPDPERIDGVLVPFAVRDAAWALVTALSGNLPVKRITMAKAELNDGQVLHAVNDLFLGQRTHVSARYRIRFRGQAENHSSSGIIVSTGAGSTGWFRSILTGAAGVVSAFSKGKGPHHLKDRYAFDAASPVLKFNVREPFISKVSTAEIVSGEIRPGEHLEVVSQMPQNGVIFSDGVEEDFLPFPSGATARIGRSERVLHALVLTTHDAPGGPPAESEESVDEESAAAHHYR